MVSRAKDELSVFVIGGGGPAVYEARWTGQGWFPFYSHCGNLLPYDPVTISRGKNDISLFCVGLDPQ